MPFTVLCLLLAAASASGTSLGSPRQQRIVGGDLTTIDRYPSAATVHMYNCFTNTFRYECGSVIINKRSVLTTALCVRYFIPANYCKTRIGSSYANSGGVVHEVSRILLHPEYNVRTHEHDVAILYSATEFEFNSNAAPGQIAWRDYPLGDNEPVWAVGWGQYNLSSGALSEQLRDVELFTINWEKCRERYSETRSVLYENMLCAGIWDVGGKDQCGGDAGSPLYHNQVVVGLCSWGRECASRRYPTVNVLVSAYADWISAN